MDFQTELICIF